MLGMKAGIIQPSKCKAQIQNTKKTMKYKYNTVEEVRNIIFGINVDSYNRIYVFALLVFDINPEIYWTCLRMAYQHSDNLFHYRPIPKFLFKYPIGDPKTMMDEKESLQFDKLPDRLTIFRGMSLEENKSKDYGLSWALNQETANYFANKYLRNFNKTGDGIVVSKEVSKSDCLGLLYGREEQEIIFRSTTQDNQSILAFNLFLANMINQYEEKNNNSEEE